MPRFPGISMGLTLPYWAVIFTSQRTDDGAADYARAADDMMALAATQPGYLGVESTRGADGLGITVSYWATKEAIVAWRNHAEHTLIRNLGRENWYRAYSLRVAHVERGYEWTKV